MDRYKLLISQVTTVLKAVGYKKRGTTFFLFHKEGNIGLINFQKSTSNTAEKIKFTINLGVYSKKLSVFDPMEVNLPVADDCQWHNRIGFLMPVKQDFWWEINNSIFLPDLIENILYNITEIALPEIERHITDEKLENIWLKEESMDKTSVSTYMYLIAFLKAKESPLLQTMISKLKERCKGKYYFNLAKEQLLRIDITL